MHACAQLALADYTVIDHTAQEVVPRSYEEGFSSISQPNQDNPSQKFSEINFKQGRSLQVCQEAWLLGNSRLTVRADHHMNLVRFPQENTLQNTALLRDCVSCHSVYFQLVVTQCAEQTNGLALVTHNLSKHCCPKVSHSWECNIKCVLIQFPLMGSSHRKCISL